MVFIRKQNLYVGGMLPTPRAIQYDTMLRLPLDVFRYNLLYLNTIELSNLLKIPTIPNDYKTIVLEEIRTRHTLLLHARFR
jgi:hypothetical protein